MICTLNFTYNFHIDDCLLKWFVCVLKVFICEQKLYSRSQLAQHMKTGDSDVDGSEVERNGFAGHPMCEFCKSSFYGDNELYTHMSREHYSCHICQRYTATFVLS